MFSEITTTKKAKALHWEGSGYNCVSLGIHLKQMAETSFVSKFALSHMYLVVPSDIAVPPGPGGMYRNMNTTFQRNNERAPVYELPPIHTTIEKNISNMSTQSSPGFDSFSALLSNTQKKWFGMIVVRVTLKTCCFPFLLTCSICFCQTVSPHIFGTKLKSRLYTRKVQLHPHRIIAC